MHFNHAPADVVWEIARNVQLLPREYNRDSYKFQLSSRDQKSLRLTCSQLNLATESLVLRYLVINIFSKPPTVTVCQLQTLAEGKTRVSELSRSLKIECLKPPPPSLHEDAPRWLKYLLGLDSYDVEACMTEYLVKAISNLKRVESVA